MQTTNYQKHVSQNPIQKALLNNFYRSFLSIIKNTKADKILDVGCGEGFTIQILKEKNIGTAREGIDVLPEAVEVAKKNIPDEEFKVGSIYDLPYKDNSFDLVLCMEVLEHLEDPQVALQELKRVSSKHIFFSVPHEPWFQLTNLLRLKYAKNLGNHPEHINHWSAASFKKFIEKNKLQVEERRLPYAWIQVLAKK